MEDKRVTFFLLGLILSFSLIFVGLQYKSHPYDPDLDAESLEDLAQDLELSTPSEQKDMVSAEAPAAPVSKSITQEVKAADKVEEAPQKSTPRRVNWLLVMARELWMEPKSRRLCQRLQWITPILQRWLRHLSTSPWFSKSQSSLVAGQLSCNGLPRTSNIRNQPRMPRYKARWSAPLLLIRMARCAM